MYATETRTLRTRLNEYIKSYDVFSAFDAAKAAEYLQKINEIRLHIALLAEQRQNFYHQINVIGNTQGYTENYYFTRNDIKFIVNRGIANLLQHVNMSLLHAGKLENVLTRQAVQWQQLFSNTQFAPLLGQQIPFDLSQELVFGKNQSLNIQVTNQTEAGWLFMHGCNLKDDYSPNIANIQDEINNTPIPRPRLIPVLFKFEDSAADTLAVSADNTSDISSVKSDESVILYEVSTTSINSRMSITDTGRNQNWCNRVESLGIAGLYTDQYTTYYPLPYPHLLRAGDRLNLPEVLNGSDITSDTEDADVIQYLTFRGHTL